MKIKTLVLGSGKMIDSICNSLLAMGSEIVRLYEIPETITVLKQENFNLVIVDGSIDDVVNVCFRLIWVCRLRVMVAAQNVVNIFNQLRPIGIEGYLNNQIKQDEFISRISAVAQKGNQQFDKIKVLLIEDDRYIQEAVAMFFQIFWPEAELTGCRNGLDGLKLAREKTQDIVLLDLGLPDIDGFEVLGKLRSFSNVPVVILTAQREKEQIVRAMQSGANDYIIKPFKQIDVMIRIKKAVSLGRIPVLTRG